MMVLARYEINGNKVVWKPYKVPEFAFRLNLYEHQLTNLKKRFQYNDDFVVRFMLYPPRFPENVGDITLIRKNKLLFLETMKKWNDQESLRMKFYNDIEVFVTETLYHGTKILEKISRFKKREDFENFLKFYSNFQKARIKHEKTFIKL